VAKRQKAESIHDRDRIIVRLPEGMRDKIAAMALANGRSMTAEVIAALEQHLKGADRITRLWEFFEKQHENIEAIPRIWGAVENLEWQVEHLTGAPLRGLRQARETAEKDES
jgi:plasmid stability protein